jgi:hypothetical protein
VKKEAYTILLRAVGVGSSLRLGQQAPTSGWGKLRFLAATARQSILDLRFEILD